MNLYEMLKQSADKNPQKIALICKNDPFPTVNCLIS